MVTIKKMLLDIIFHKNIQMKKQFLNRKINISNNNYYLEKHYYILSSKSCFLTKKQIDSCINVIRFYIRKFKKKKQKMFINLIQYNIPVTKKNKFSRMGSGKGKIRKYISKINMNGIMFIFKNVKKSIMLKIYKYIQFKLPMKIYLKS